MRSRVRDARSGLAFASCLIGFAGSTGKRPVGGHGLVAVPHPVATTKPATARS